MTDRVRVGVSIRQPEARIRLGGPASVRAVGRDKLLHRFAAGEYSIKTGSPGNAAAWGARLAVFHDRDTALTMTNRLLAFEVPVDIVEMGEQIEWGGHQLSTEVFAVVCGSGADREEVLGLARERLLAIPVERTRGIAGLRVEEDEIPHVEAVRLTPPRGGDLILTSDRGDSAHSLPSPFQIVPDDPSATLELADVRIGIQFHWEHSETLAFRGALEIVADGDAVTVVNDVALDDYLASLLGSEMRPDWPEEALAAQAIAARSTVLATRKRHHYGEAFDLCHDDHCQCYQGVAREGDTANAVLERVRGLLLAYGDRVADARYAKIHGVLSDSYETAWDDEPVPYLVPVSVGPSGEDGLEEAEAAFSRSGRENLELWIKHPPEWAAANPVTHPYPPSAADMKDLFRWTARLDWDEITSLVELRTGKVIGQVRQLDPLSRGISGRIIRLRAHGSEGTVTVGKELAVRRLLSTSHLPSSAFLISEEKDGVRLEGLGWGHGVGLDQLGAAGLAAAGWDYHRLLAHFYPGTSLVSAGSKEAFAALAGGE